VNTHTIARLNELYPELARRGRLSIAVALTFGFTIEVDQGVRTWMEQTRLWRLGRDAKGNIVDPTKVVTHAKAGESYHNFGLAFDFVPFDENAQPIWLRSHPAYGKFIQIAEGYGLTSGSRWPEPETDFPHVQFTNDRFPQSPDLEVRYLFREGGFRAVWAEIDKSFSRLSST
jgi:peptidoglycan L-alanyl-D-glutamate endopeptidase CwlK